MEVGERLTVIQQHKKEDVVGNEMVDQPPLIEPEGRKGEEIEQAASESRHLADELAGMLDRLEIEEERSADVNAVVPGEQEVVEGDDDGRGGASRAEEIVENPFFNGLDEEGDNDSKMDGAVGESKGLIIKREAEDQEAKEEAEELKEREEEERTRKEHEEEERRAKEKREAERKLKEEHEAEQRVEGEAERQAKEIEVAEKEAREKERMDRARMMEEMLRDHYEEKSEKES